MLVYVLAVVVFGLDQLVKYIVRTTMAVNQMIPIWPHVLVLDYIRNPGAAWGMLGHARYFLIVVALIVIAAVVYVQSKYRPKIGYQIGLGLVLGGALGNLMDRIVYGNVTDYIYFQMINFPVFNLADSAITIGVIFILLLSLRSGQNRPNGPSQDTQ